jgi:hypothetical protein
LISDIYFGEKLKRRTLLSKEAKDLKRDIQAHVGECVYFGKFPSVQGIETGGNIDDAEVYFEFIEQIVRVIFYICAIYD